METEDQILQFISLQESSKQQDLLILHELMTSILPNGKLWLDDGKNEEGKVVTNPTIGYGEFEHSYANGNRKTHFHNETRNLHLFAGYSRKIRFGKYLCGYWSSESDGVLHSIQVPCKNRRKHTKACDSICTKYFRNKHENR